MQNLGQPVCLSGLWSLSRVAGQLNAVSKLGRGLRKWNLDVKQTQHFLYFDGINIPKQLYEKISEFLIIELVKNVVIDPKIGGSMLFKFSTLVVLDRDIFLIG